MGVIAYKYPPVPASDQQVIENGRRSGGGKTMLVLNYLLGMHAYQPNGLQHSCFLCGKDAKHHMHGGGLWS